MAVNRTIGTVAAGRRNPRALPGPCAKAWGAATEAADVRARRAGGLAPDVSVAGARGPHERALPRRRHPAPGSHARSGPSRSTARSGVSRSWARARLPEKRVGRSGCSRCGSSRTRGRRWIVRATFPASISTASTRTSSSVWAGAFEIGPRPLIDGPARADERSPGPETRVMANGIGTPAVTRMKGEGAPSTPAGPRVSCTAE